MYNEGMMNYEIENKTECPKSCHKKICKCGLTAIFLPAVLGDDSASSEVAPKNGSYCNAIVTYEANGAVYIYSKEGIPVKVKEGDK